MTFNLRRVGSTLAFASLLAVTGCKDLKIESDKPQYQFGEVATMWLLFKDQRVPDGEGSFTWKSNRDGNLGNGNTITLDTLSAGDHTLTVEGKYKGKKAKSKKKKITVTNEKPRALVHAPLNGTSFPVGTTVEFRGAANDLEDGQISGSALAWASSIDGTLGYGSTISVSNLSPGSHRITLSAADKAGAKGSSTFRLEVTNQAPVATISQPSSDLTINVMEVLTLRGSGVDPDPVLGSAQIPASQLSWRSDEDGALGTGAEVSTSELSGGTHTITLTAKDEFGKAGRATVKVRVINEPPTARITSPGNNNFFAANDTITFHVDARDPETSLDEDKIVWRSNRDGRIGRGFRLRTDDLSVDEHTITVEVTDKHGASVRDSVKILITNEAPVAQIEQPLNGSRYRSAWPPAARSRWATASASRSAPSAWSTACAASATSRSAWWRRMRTTPSRSPSPPGSAWSTASPPCGSPARPRVSSSPPARSPSPASVRTPTATSTSRARTWSGPPAAPTAPCASWARASGSRSATWPLAATGSR
jgi:hypothetical protein